MSLQSRITEYSVMVQYVNPFERDLRSIGTAISKGEALRWKYDNDCYLFTLFNSTLVNREFTFYASHPFYSGNGAKAFSQVPKADESPQSISTNKNEAVATDLLFLPWVPDPMPLSLALVTDWDAYQPSEKNIEVLKKNGFQFSEHRRKNSKNTENTDADINSHTHEQENKSRRFLEPFAKIRSWKGMDWPYFPSFFVIAFLSLQNSEQQLLRKALSPKSRGYYQVTNEKSEQLESLCDKISGFGRRLGYIPNSSSSDSNTPAKKTKATMMREYIAMVAFICLLQECYRDQAVENILMLDYLTGLCTAFWGYEKMQTLLTRWKSPKTLINSTDASSTMLSEYVKSILPEPIPYKEDNIIQKMETQPELFFPDTGSQAKERFQELSGNGGCSPTDALCRITQITILQFKEIDALSIDPTFSNEQLKKVQNDCKKKALDEYFKARGLLLKNEPVNFDAIIKQHVESIRSVEKARFGDVPSASPETNYIAMSPENLKEQSRYNALKSGWIKFFLVRRMQNNEPPMLLYYLGDFKQTLLEHLEDEHKRLSKVSTKETEIKTNTKSKKYTVESAYKKNIDKIHKRTAREPLYRQYLDYFLINTEIYPVAIQFLSEIDAHYPADLWPYPETTIAALFIRESLKRPIKETSDEKTAEQGNEEGEKGS